MKQQINYAYKKISKNKKNSNRIQRELDKIDKIMRNLQAIKRVLTNDLYEISYQESKLKQIKYEK